MCDIKIVNPLKERDLAATDKRGRKSKASIALCPRERILSETPLEREREKRNPNFCDSERDREREGSLCVCVE